MTFCHHPFCSSIRQPGAAQEENDGEVTGTDVSELLGMLARVPDFRSEKGREYALSFILAVCVVAALAGAKNYREIATVTKSICQCQLRKLGAEWDYFEKCYKYPRQTTIWYVLTGIDAAELDSITGEWLFSQARKYRGENGDTEWEIAIDGKVLRGAWTSENDQVTLFSAMLHREAVTVAQVRVPDGTNETTQVKALVKEIGILGRETMLATLDAAHCNKETAEAVSGKPGWDYSITVKTDKPTLYRKATGRIRPALGRDPDDVMTDRSRGVIKTWSCWITEAKDIKFPNIAQVACILREVHSLTGEKLSKDIAIQVTSRAPDKMSAADMNMHTRKHWGIENKSHYIRDTVYREDHNRGWDGNGPQALASLRNFATGLFRLKNTRSIKQATEMVHMDRTLALHYLDTRSDVPHVALPPNGPGPGPRPPLS